MLYLVEGMAGLPVFSPIGVGGTAQLFGPTGGFLLAYPFVAFVAGYVFERGTRSFARAVISGFFAEILLFVGGLSWLYVLTHSLAKAAYLGLYWFIAAEVMKVMFAAAVATRWQRSGSGKADVSR
jgi:biotin transport system substrate-specific component